MKIIAFTERQRREHGLDVAAQLSLRPDLRLQQIGDDVLMREHRPLGDAGGAARVLQEGDVAMREAYRRERARIADGERIEQSHRFRQVVFRHHLLDVPQHEVQQPSLRVQSVGQQVAESRDDHVLHARARQCILDGLCEVLEHDDGLRAAVLQLVGEFAHRIQRVDVDHHGAGLQDPEQRDRILKGVGQHDGDTLARLHADALQPRREGGGLARQFAIGEVGADAYIGDALAELGGALVEELHDRLVLMHIDLMRHIRRVGRVPDTVGVRCGLCRVHRDGRGRHGWGRWRLGGLVHGMSPEARRFVCVCLCVAVSCRCAAAKR
jgi:hypothetical protein